MGQITAIQSQKNNQKRANIFIDGEYYCSLDKMAVLSFSLKVGTEIDEERLKMIMLDSEAKSAFDSAIKLISGRMKSENELKKYLKSKKFDDSVITSTVLKLKEYKYLNDEEYAKAYIKTYRAKFGNKKLTYDLLMKGVSEEIVQRMLDDEGGDEEEAADQAAQKYLRTHRPPVSYTKLASHLYSKGFGSEIAKETAKKYAEIPS